MTAKINIVWLTLLNKNAVEPMFTGLVPTTLCLKKCFMVSGRLRVNRFQ